MLKSVLVIYYEGYSSPTIRLGYTAQYVKVSLNKGCEIYRRDYSESKPLVNGILSLLYYHQSRGSSKTGNGVHAEVNLV